MIGGPVGRAMVGPLIVTYVYLFKGSKTFYLETHGFSSFCDVLCVFTQLGVCPTMCFFSQNFGGVEMSRKVVVFGDCVFCLTPIWGKIPVLILIFQMG